MHPQSSGNKLYPPIRYCGKEGALKRGRIQEVLLTTHMAHHLTAHCGLTRGEKEREIERGGDRERGGGGREREAASGERPCGKKIGKLAGLRYSAAFITLT